MNLVSQDSQAEKDLEGTQVRRGHQDPEEYPEKRVFQSRGRKEWTVLQDEMVRKDRRASVVSPDLEVSLEILPLASLVRRDHRVPSVIRAKMVCQEHQEYQDLAERKEIEVDGVKIVVRVPRARKVTVDVMALRDLQDSGVHPASAV